MTKTQEERLVVAFEKLALAVNRAAAAFEICTFADEQADGTRSLAISIHDSIIVHGARDGYPIAIDQG